MNSVNESRAAVWSRGSPLEGVGMNFNPLLRNDFSNGASPGVGRSCNTSEGTS